jgi:quercetin 2,3-dioxygenase
MKTVLHKADTRGAADHGWLKAKHTFSFANYYDPTRVHFGALRVLNDDIVGPAMGFGTHPHDNMEIVTIILKGKIRHQDSMGNKIEIAKDEIQIMSAGTGITHSEFNAEKHESLNLLQIWIMPKKKNITPRYDQMSLNTASMHNHFLTIITPDSSQPMWINQDAWFSMAHLDSGKNVDYSLNIASNGVYVFVIEGEVQIGNQVLSKRDGLGITDIDKFEVNALAESKVLLMEVPV